MSKFKLAQTATEVQDILNNSLQKPTGLAKTKLVGVGVNGQENIEIGDNLTLANGKLAAAGGVNGLESDAEGNLTASKNLKVNGKLKLQSLVSNTNPDGDITKELGGQARHAYMVSVNRTFQYVIYTTKDYDWEIGATKYISVSDFMTDNNYKELTPKGKAPASGFYYDNSKSIELIPFQIESTSTRGFWILHGTNLATKEYKTAEFGGDSYSATKLF